MAQDLPSIPNTVPQVRAPTPMVSAAQIAQPYQEAAQALDRIGDAHLSAARAHQQAASADQQIAGANQSLGDTLMKDVAVPAAEKAGLRAVTRDQDGNLQVEKAPIFGEAAGAYSRAVKMGALADGEGVAKRDDIAMRDQYRDNPQGYVKAADEYRQAKIKQYTDAVGPEVGVAMGRIIDGQTTQTYKGLLNEKERLDLQRADGSMTAQIQSARDDAVALARGGDTTSPVFRQTLSKIQTLTNEKVNNPRLAYPREQADYDLQHLDGEMRANGVLYHVDQVYKDQGVNPDGSTKGGMANAIKTAHDILTNPDLKLTETQRQQYFAKATSEIHANEAMRRQDVGEARAAAQALNMASVLGAPIQPEDVEAVAKGFRDSGAPGEAARLYATYARKPLNDAFGKQSLPVQVEQLNAMRGVATYQPMITAAAQQTGVDPVILARQLHQESGFNPNALSPKGAAGIAQFIPATAARYGVDVRDPQSSIMGQARYMADLSRQFGGNTGLALAGYNWGEGKVAAWIASGANPAAMPAETRNYVRSITGMPIEDWTSGKRPSPEATAAATGGPGAALWLQANRQSTISTEASGAWKTVMTDWHEKGIRPADPVVNQIVDAARATDNHDLLEKIGTDVDRIDLVQRQGRRSLPEQEAANAELGRNAEAGTLSIGQAAVMKDLSARQAAVSKGLDENPITTTVKNFPERFRTPAPLDLTNPENLTAGLAMRGQIATFATQNWQTQPVSALDKADLAQVKGALDTADPAGKARIFHSISTALPEPVRNATLAQIAKEGKSVDAFAGGMQSDAPDVAQSIFRGQQAIKTDDRYDPSKKTDDFNQEFDKRLPPTTFTLAARTDDNGAYAVMKGAVKARYADLAAQSGDVSGKINNDRLQTAIDDVTGGVLDLNGGKFIAPARGMDARTFEGVLAGVTDNDMPGVSTLNGQRVDANYLRAAGQLESVGDGRYLVRLGRDPLKPVYAYQGAYGEAPQKFVLDLRGRQPAVVPPLPSATLGQAP